MKFWLLLCVRHDLLRSKDFAIICYRCHGIIAFQSLGHFDAHNTPARNKLSKHGFLCHVIERLIPKGRILPHFALRDFASQQFLVLLPTERLGVGICVVHHFFFGPVQHLAETVHVLKVSHVANGR